LKRASRKGAEQLTKPEVVVITGTSAGVGKAYDEGAMAYGMFTARKV
jgi:hypothetical protein